MSCLLFWCCRGRQSDSDTENNTNQQLRKDGDKIKRKKMWRERMWKRQQKKEQTVDRERAEELQAAQQPAAGEKGSDVPHLPAGLGSGSLENISAGTPEKMRTPLHEDFQSSEDIPETSRDPTENVQDQIEAETEAEAPKLLDVEEAHNNQPLGDKMIEMMATKGEAQLTKDLVLTDLQDLQTKNLRDMNSADTEVEAIKQQKQIDGDEPVTPNDQPLGNVEKKSDAEPDWMLHYEPIKSWADFMEETEETIDDIGEYNVEMALISSGDRGIQVGAVDQWRHEHGCEETKTESENAGICKGAPDTDPQQRRAQRKECRREKCHWTLEHVQKTLQAPPEEKSAPQLDCRKNREEAHGKRTTEPESAGTCVRAPHTDPQQRGAQSKEYRREKRHWTVEHLQRTLQALHEEKSAPRTDCSQNREQAHGKKRVQLENAGTCVRAPDTVPQQRRAQRKEDRRETRHWAVKHPQKTLQAPSEENSAPQRDCRKNVEGLRIRTAEFRQKTHPKPADKPTDRGTHSFGRRIDEYGRRGAAQCCQSEPRFQTRDAPQTPSQNGERVSKREMRGNPAQCTPERTVRNDRTIRKPYWRQHDDRSAESDERQSREKHQNKKFRNGNKQWKSRRTDDQK